MRKRNNHVYIFLALLLMVTLACGLSGAKTSEPAVVDDTAPETLPTQPEQPQEVEVQPTTPPIAPEEGSANDYDTDFPIPGNIQNFMQIPQFEGGINFQTDLGLDEVVAFYRAEFSALGLVERELLTVVDETTFNLVFDGASNGKAVVIQGVFLGPGQTNVNIRYEDV